MVCFYEAHKPLRGTSTIAQMARLQGHVADRRWESGHFEARYTRTVEGWRIIYNSRDRSAQVLPSPDNQLLPGQKKVRSHVILAEQAVPKLDYEQVLGSEKPDEAEPAKAKTPAAAKPAAATTKPQPAAKTTK